MQCFSTYFRKLKEIGVLRPLFPDYVISCDYDYIEHFLILASTIAGCISISTFTSLVGITIGITSSEMELKICARKLIIKKKKKKHNKVVLLAKSKLNNIEVLISKVLINSSVSHDEIVLINNVLKKL